MSIKYYTFISLILYFISGTVGLKGAVPLDSWTFDKVLTKFDVVLVKFDVSYPYGEKEDEYAKVADATKNTPNILVTEVGVQDYGDMDNSDLAERYNVKKEDFPVVKLFVKGADTEYYTFEGDFTADNLKTFIKQHSTVRLVLDNCLVDFDNFAIKFISSTDEKTRTSVLKEVEMEVVKLEKEDKKSGQFYVKVMRKVMEKGDGFVSTEMNRVLGIKKGRVTPEKKKELQGRLNIIQSFTYKTTKDEL